MRRNERVSSVLRTGLITFDDNGREISLEEELVERRLSRSAVRVAVRRGLTGGQEVARDAAVVQGTALDVARDTQGLDPRELLHATGLVGAHVAAAGQRRQRTGHQSRIRPTEQRVRHGERAGRHVGDFREDVDRASVR